MRHSPVAAAGRRVAAFGRDERGTVLAEFVVILPLLLWTLIATYSYWDVYRSMNRVQKATFTIVDNVSREPGTTTKAYITGLSKLMEFLIDGNQNASMRVTSVRWVAANARYEAMWSCTTAAVSMPVLKTSDLPGLASKLPALVDQETLLVVETEVPYVPPLGTGKVVGLDVGVTAQTFREFVPIKPRFVPQIELTGPACT